MQPRSGDLRSADDLGDPIFVLDVRMQGSALPAAEGEHRAVFGWVSYGVDDYYDCLEETENGIILCSNDDPPIPTYLHLFDVEIESTYPSHFEVPFHAFPSRARVLSRNGGVLALGGIGIYDDRNMNGELDRISPEDEQPIDHLLAESVVTEFGTYMVLSRSTAGILDRVDQLRWDL